MHKFYDILANWYEEGKKLKARDIKMYHATNFKTMYTYVAQLVIRLYIEKSFAKPKVSWIHLIHSIADKGIIFN
jgi:hypothetical protein